MGMKRKLSLNSNLPVNTTVLYKICFCGSVMDDYSQHLTLGSIILSGILVTRFKTRKGQKAESQ